MKDTLASARDAKFKSLFASFSSEKEDPFPSLPLCLRPPFHKGHCRLTAVLRLSHQSRRAKVSGRARSRYGMQANK
jgi:hypothetical protein